MSDAESFVLLESWSSATSSIDSSSSSSSDSEEDSWEDESKMKPKQLSKDNPIVGWLGSKFVRNLTNNIQELENEDKDVVTLTASVQKFMKTFQEKQEVIETTAAEGAVGADKPHFSGYLLTTVTGETIEINEGKNDGKHHGKIEETNNGNQLKATIDEDWVKLQELNEVMKEMKTNLNQLHVANQAKIQEYKVKWEKSQEEVELLREANLSLMTDIQMLKGEVKQLKDDKQLKPQKTSSLISSVRNQAVQLKEQISTQCAWVKDNFREQK